MLELKFKMLTNTMTILLKAQPNRLLVFDIYADIPNPSKCLDGKW